MVSLRLVAFPLRLCMLGLFLLRLGALHTLRAARTRSQLTKHVYPVLGVRPLARIRARELQAFVTGLPVAPSSVRPIWATVRATLSAAVRDRLIPYDPADRIKLPELPRQQVTPLAVEQVDRLADAMPARYRALVVVGAGCGRASCSACMWPTSTSCAGRCGYSARCSRPLAAGTR
ncbi:hypothetical protein [Micromonospora sp. MA102]|uniref:hypothetical protein n=1 Tax=Micromonospora sp. MA102 TaxID=2952755 RepID=UPI0021C74206|nr:hypothetical protein [Micromonospora sp. MA102]